MNSIRAFAQDLLWMRTYILWSAVLFFGGMAFGYGSNALDAYLLQQMDALRNTAIRMEQMDNAQLWIFLFIFFNNFIKSIAVVFLGALFGVFPVFFLALNGMLIGFVVSLAGDMGTDVFDLVVRGILPHGVLEITAILIAAAYGLKYGALIAKELYRAAVRGTKGEEKGEIKAFHGTLKRLIAFLFLALLAAAFIESTVTYFLVRG